MSNGSNSEILEVIAENDLINGNPIAPISIFFMTLQMTLFPLNSINADTEFMEGGSWVDHTNCR